MGLYMDEAFTLTAIAPAITDTNDRHGERNALLDAALVGPVPKAHAQAVEQREGRE